MKKFYSLLIVIMTFSLFLFILDIYSEREVSDTYNIYGLDDWEATSNIQFTSNIKDMADEVYIDKLEKLADKHNIIIISDRIEHDGRGQEDFIFYVYPDTDMEELFELNITKRKLKRGEENSTEGLFYSTDNSLNPDHHINLINSKLDVTIYPFSYLKQDPIQKYRPIKTFSKSEENVRAFNADILEAFSFASPEIDVMHSHSFDYDEAFRNQIKVFFILCSVLLSLFMIFNVSDEMKRIAIEKMHGFSNGRIALNLFSPIVLYVIFIQAITTILSFTIYIHQWNKTVINFMQEYLIAIGIIDMVFIVILIFVFLVIRHLKLPKLIKNYNFNNMLLNITFFIKIIFVILLIPMFLNGLKNLTILIPDYMEIKRVEDDYYGILNIDSNTIETRFDGYDIKKYVEGEIDEVYEHHLNIYNQLSSTDNLIFQARSTATILNASKKIYHGFSVDGNYLKKNPIIGQDGEAIDLDLSGDFVYILLPESIYNENKNNNIESAFYTDGNPAKIIPIQEGQSFIDYSFIIRGPLGMEKYQETPFFEVYSDNSFRYDKSIMIRCYLIGFKDMKEAMLELGKMDPGMGYILSSAEERIEDKKAGIRDGVLKSIFSLIPATVIILAMNFSILGLYYRSKRKKLSILRLNGYSSVLANVDLLVELLLSFVVPTFILYFIHSKDIFLASGYALVIDIICAGFVLLYYRRMKIVL